ncbi:hypothetical protein E2986_07014 [Frieseomelitta varia]|uniref:Photoreceptor outer segment membrane glycoprotein 2 n=1 Tax=Frieseomelitta varia TaxID=561572 RepID=A0A833RTM0_9HYME|nr:hypothetical protein E2986_07014 [Frieseomelitta varia]
MGLVNAVYNWPSVKALYFTVFSMNLAGLLALVLAIVWAVRFERGFGDYLNLITPGDGHVWTAIIVSAGVCCSPAYILGVKCWLYLKLEPARTDLGDQQRADDTATVDPHDVNRLLFFHVVACLLSGFLVAILNATYLVLLSGFQQKSRDGLIEAIEKYGADVAVKARLDALQSELECCGDGGYEDWARVPWLKMSMEEEPEDVENGPRLEGQSVSEERDEETTTMPVDVPFSCCSNGIAKPCVHHDILSPSAVYEYNPKHVTITTDGCRSKIVNRGEVIRTFLAGYLALLSVYQMVLSYMSRLLQTAHSNELYIGPQKTRYHVWIFFKPEDLPGNEERRSERMRPRRKQSRLSFPFALSKSSDDDKEEEERSSQRCKNRRNNTKVLTRIRSRISSVKSKSVPVVRPSFLSGSSRCKKQRGARRLEEMEEAKPEEESRLLLSEYATRSESILKKDRSSIVSLLSNGSSVNLPPPPPPFALTLENEELSPFEIVPSKSSGTRTKFSQPLSESIITSQNSGRRAKVLEKFGEIRERCDKSTQHRESGGADIPSGDPRLVRTRFSSTDVYDRFRGTLQHTLARREAVRARKESARVYNPPGYSQKKLDVGRNNFLARIKCNNVPPSYRLLADFQLHERSVLQTHVPPIPSFLLPPAPPPPPPPPPLPFSPPNPVKRSRNSARICGTKVVSTREQRQCSICNRPVVQSPGSSRQSLVEACKDARTFSSSARRKARATFSRHREFLRGDYVP